MTTRHIAKFLFALAAAVIAASPCAADDKDLLKQGTADPNVIVILSNTVSMQYLPYVQGTTPVLPPDGQFGDSPVSKFGLAKSAFRQVVEDNSSNFNFGLSWYSYHQEGVSHKYWSYQSTRNNTISNAAWDFPNDTFKAAVGTYYEIGTSGGGPIQSISTTRDLRHHGLDDLRLLVRRRSGRLELHDGDLRRLRDRADRQGPARGRAPGAGQRRAAVRAARDPDDQGVPDRFPLGKPHDLDDPGIDPRRQPGHRPDPAGAARQRDLDVPEPLLDGLRQRPLHGVHEAGRLGSQLRLRRLVRPEQPAGGRHPAGLQLQPLLHQHDLRAAAGVLLGLRPALHAAPVVGDPLHAGRVRDLFGRRILPTTIPAPAARRSCTPAPGRRTRSRS